MTPNRMLDNEFPGNGLKQRVTACRKRLRVNRHHQRHSSVAQSLFTAEVNAHFPGESVAVRESLVGGDDDSEHCRGWIRPELEIGIT